MSTDRLASTASQGAVTTIGAQAIRVAVQILGTVVLARLLDPNDYGLIAEVLTVVGLGEILRDFGLTNAAVQVRTLSDDERNNLFWLNTGTGAVLALLVAGAAPLVAALYRDERLVPLTTLLAVTFVSNGLSTQFRADLNRRLAFVRLAGAEIAGQIAGLAIGLVMAVVGAGYWALAGQQIGIAATTLVLLWSTARFRPRAYRRDVPMRRFITFGLDVVGAQLLGYASKNTDTVVIGTTLGATALGFYNRAFQLLTLPLSQINAPSTRVALSVLARLQDDSERFRNYLLAGQTVMLHLVLAVFAWSSALAGPLVLLVLGPQWTPSVLLFQILAVSGVFQTAGYTTYWVFLAKGLTRSQLWWQVWTRPVLVGVILLGSLWGVVGVAATYSAGSLLMWVLGLVWIGRVSDAPVGAMFFNALKALIGHALAAAAAASSLVLTAGDPAVFQLLIGTVLWAAVLLIEVLVWPAFRADMTLVVSVARRLRTRRIVISTGAATVASRTPEE